MPRNARRKREREIAKSVMKWTPLEQMDYLFNPATGVQMAIPAGTFVFRNSRYLVISRELKAVSPFGKGYHLSIKRNDQEIIRDWRDLQRIKNELFGPEAEAVELFPAESRLVDAANQYHLWVFPTYRFPFGQTFREVGSPEDAAEIGARQREFEDLSAYESYP